MSHEPSRVFIEWPEYIALLKQLFERIRDAGWKPEQVICIARGGLIPGDLASRFFRVPLAVLSVASYPDHATAQEEMHFSRDLTTARPLKRSGILLIDDLTESGKTLSETVKWLAYWYGIPSEEIRSAVVWHKEWSTFRPDFYSDVIKEGPGGERPWIIQPQERFREES